jgi:hypothetical protein
MRYNTYGTTQMDEMWDRQQRGYGQGRQIGATLNYATMMSYQAKPQDVVWTPEQPGILGGLCVIRRGIIIPERMQMHAVC